MAELCPIVVLKPSTSEVGKDGVYSTPKDLFFPTTGSVNLLLAYLNEINMNDPEQLPRHAKEPSKGLSWEKCHEVTTTSSEDLADQYQCNILGGAFLAFLTSMSVPLERISGSALVTSGDKEFLTGFYPDLIPVFKADGQVQEEMRLYAQGVVYNNAGKFKVIGIRQETCNDPRILDRLVALKKVYRHGAKMHIEHNQTGVRDNLVHSPETPEMLKFHMDLLQARFVFAN